MSSFLKLSKQCGDDCIVPSVDTEDCLDDLVRCVRTAPVCGGCTCLDLKLGKNQTITNPFHWCYCALDDHKSLDTPDPGTAIVTAFSLSWIDVTAITDADLLAAAVALSRDAGAAVVWKFFERALPQPCPVSTAGWTAREVSIDGGSTYVGELTNPPFGSIFAFRAGPVPYGPDPDGSLAAAGIVDCSQNLAPKNLLLQIRAVADGCNALLALCPLPGADADVVTCPTDARCCCPGLTNAFPEPCVDGTTAIDYRVVLTAAHSPCVCTGRTGSIRVTKGDYTDSHDISDIADDGDATGTFDGVPCDGTDGETWLITITWTTDPVICDSGADCPCPETQCYTTTIDGVITPAACP